MLRVERLERQYLADRQGFATAVLMSGSKDSEFPSWEQYLADEYANLCRPPTKLREAVA